jgi:hypothetical protein
LEVINTTIESLNTAEQLQIANKRQREYRELARANMKAVVTKEISSAFSEDTSVGQNETVLDNEKSQSQSANNSTVTFDSSKNSVSIIEH